MNWLVTKRTDMLQDNLRTKELKQNYQECQNGTIKIAKKNQEPH